MSRKNSHINIFLWARFSQSLKATSSNIAVENICRLRATHHL